MSLEVGSCCESLCSEAIISAKSSANSGSVPLGHQGQNVLVEGRVVGEAQAGFAAIHNLSIPVYRTRGRLAHYLFSDPGSRLANLTELPNEVREHKVGRGRAALFASFFAVFVLFCG